MIKELKALRQHLETLERFSAKYPNVPFCSVSHLAPDDGPIVSFFDKSETAQMFGPDGWNRKSNFSQTHWHYVKMVDGVKLVLFNAERIESSDGGLVDPESLNWTTIEVPEATAEATK